MKKLINRSFILSLFMLTSTWLIANEKANKDSEKALVEVNHTYTKDTNEMTFTFAAKPTSGHKIVTDGAPWRLKIEKADHLNFAGNTDQSVAYSSNSFDEDIPGFQVKAKLAAGQKSGTFPYEMKAFVCEKENQQQCFFLTLTGNAKWEI
ncbi:MAG: hypothetical protein ACOH5I_11785 [Oligoflexus sp.]